MLLLFGRLNIVYISQGVHHVNHAHLIAYLAYK